MGSEILEVLGPLEDLDFVYSISSALDQVHVLIRADLAHTRSFGLHLTEMFFVQMDVDDEWRLVDFQIESPIHFGIHLETLSLDRVWDYFSPISRLPRGYIIKQKREIPIVLSDQTGVMEIPGPIRATRMPGDGINDKFVLDAVEDPVLIWDNRIGGLLEVVTEVLIERTEKVLEDVRCLT